MRPLTAWMPANRPIVQFSLFGLLLLVLLSFTSSAMALTLGDSVTRHDVETLQPALFRDAARALTGRSALEAYRAGRFGPVHDNVGLGFTRDAVWLAFEVERPADAPARWVLELQPAFLDQVDFYALQPDGRMVRQRGGDALPLAERAFNHRAAAFRLDLAEGTTQLLVRVVTTSNVSLIPLLWQSAAFEHQQHIEAYRLGFYFGLMALVFAYTLIAWIAVRERLFLVYAMFVASVTGQQLAYNGLAGLYLFPDDPLTANRMLAVMLSLTVAFGMRFYQTIMGVTREDQVSWLYLNGCVLLGLASAVSVPFGLFPVLSPWMQGSVVLSTLFFAVPVWRRWREGTAEGRLFAIAFVLFFALVDITILATLGLIGISMFSLHAAMLGHVAHLFLLHVGLFLRARLADRRHREAEQEIERQRLQGEQERAILEEQEHLLAMISHEVQTPVAVISAAVQSLDLIDGQRADDDPRKRRFERIHRAVERISMLLQLVSASRRGVEAPYDGLELESLDLAVCCHDAVELLGKDRDRFALGLAMPGPSILGHSQHLAFLLVNLYDNALKYSEPGSAIDVTLADEVRDGVAGCRVSVCNHGRPFPPGMEEAFFEKYARGGETSGQPGLGLGLHIARGIATRHGGQLTARNAGPTRVCFDLWLPTSVKERDG